MKTVLIAVSFAALVVMESVASFQGLDLRKRSSWLYGAFGFLCGLVLIIAITGNLLEGLEIGAIFAFIILFTGVTMRRHKQKYKGKAEAFARKYEEEDPPSLLSKLAKKLLNKYK